MREIIEKVIAAGVKAPSGENCQPWRFEVVGNAITIYNLPERDQSLYSWGGRSSCVAHGALIENMLIAASALGYCGQVTLFPRSDNPDCMAVVTLGAAASEGGLLYPYIGQRVTNRKPYQETTLSNLERNEFFSAVATTEGVRLALVEDREIRTAVARAAAENELILLGNRYLHDFFFSHVTWSEAEDRGKGIGLYVKTLELPPPAEAMFKIFKNWSILRILKAIGITKMVPRENAKLNATGAAMGLITVSGNGPLDYIAAGRAMEQVWLTATKLGFSLQPLTGILFLSLRIKASDTEKFSRKEIQIINQAYDVITGAFGVADGEIPAILFRVGKSDPPTARATRLPPEVRFSSLNVFKKHGIS